MFDDDRSRELHPEALPIDFAFSADIAEKLLRIPLPKDAVATMTAEPVVLDTNDELLAALQHTKLFHFTLTTARPARATGLSWEVKTALFKDRGVVRDDCMYGSILNSTLAFDVLDLDQIVEARKSQGITAFSPDWYLDEVSIDFIMSYFRDQKEFECVLQTQMEKQTTRFFIGPCCEITLLKGEVGIIISLGPPSKESMIEYCQAQWRQVQQDFEQSQSKLLEIEAALLVEKKWDVDKQYHNHGLSTPNEWQLAHEKHYMDFLTRIAVPHWNNVVSHTNDFTSPDIHIEAVSFSSGKVERGLPLKLVGDTIALRGAISTYETLVTHAMRALLRVPIAHVSPTGSAIVTSSPN